MNTSLSWWNKYIRVIGIDLAYVTTWEELKKRIIGKYCPMIEINKLEKELWSLTKKGIEILAYTS